MTGDELDPVVHAPVRLRAMVTLAALSDGDALSFPRLQQALDLTPGNLITHLRKLEAAGYILSAKSGAGTSIALTATGRKALNEYTAALRAIIDTV